VPGASADQGRLLLTVTDRGEGIPEPFIATMWDPFSQSGHLGSAPATGVGLGLTVVKLLAGANDIEIVYDTTDGGARFRLWIPIPVGAARNEDAAVPDEDDDTCVEQVEMSGSRCIR